MNENTSYITCRPSQLVNLKYTLLTLMMVAVFLLFRTVIPRFLEEVPIPENLALHLKRLRGYLTIIVLIGLAYRIVKTSYMRYEITPEELEYHSGIFNRKHEYIELYRIKDFEVQQPFLYRMFGRGDLILYTSDKTTPEFRMQAIRDPKETYRILRAFVERNRRLKHVYEVD